MTNSPVELRDWVLPAGSLVKVDGIPYSLAANTVVRGAMDPQQVVSQSVTGESEGKPE